MLKITYTFTGVAHRAYVAAYLEKLDTGWTLEDAEIAGLRAAYSTEDGLDIDMHNAPARHLRLAELERNRGPIARA